MPSAKELRAALFHSDGSLQEFTSKVPATEFFPNATGYGAIQEQPPLVPVLKGEETIGYVFLTRIMCRPAVILASRFTS